MITLLSFANYSLWHLYFHWSDRKVRVIKWHDGHICTTYVRCQQWFSLPCNGPVHQSSPYSNYSLPTSDFRQCTFFLKVLIIELHISRMRTNILWLIYSRLFYIVYISYLFEPKQTIIADWYCPLLFSSLTFPVLLEACFMGETNLGQLVQCETFAWLRHLGNVKAITWTLLCS